jgi:hypothetical protein
MKLTQSDVNDGAEYIRYEVRDPDSILNIIYGPPNREYNNIGRLIKLKNLLILCCLTVMLTSIILTPSYIHASSNAPVLFHKCSSPYGIPYSEWLKNWWQWWISIPNNEHPFPKYDSKICSVNQQGPVWFLPDVEPTGQLTHASVKYSCEFLDDSDSQARSKRCRFDISNGDAI